MNELNIQEFNQAMIDVRKSYRLIYSFQSRIVDLANYIATHWGLELKAGHSWFSKSLSGKRVKLDLKSWNWLPMYYYNFYFIRKDGLQFGLILQADTGFFDSESVSKNKVTNFSSSESAQTRIILAASNGKWNSEAIREDKTFGQNKVIYPDNGRTLKDEDVKIIAKAYSIDKFIDEESTLIQLVDFENFTKEKQLDIELTKEN